MSKERDKKDKKKENDKKEVVAQENSASTSHERGNRRLRGNAVMGRKDR